jgi:hypothetical protein
MPAAAAKGLWMLITKQSVSEAHVAAMLYCDNSTVTPGAASYGQRYCSDAMGGAGSNARKRTISDSDEDSDDDGAGVGVTLRPHGPGTYHHVREVLNRRRGEVPTDDFVALHGAPPSRAGLHPSARSRRRKMLTRAPRRSTPTQQSSGRRKVRCAAQSHRCARARAAVLTLASAHTSRAQRMVSTNAACDDDEEDEEAGEDDEMNDSDRDFLDDRSEDALSYMSSENGSA